MNRKVYAQLLTMTTVLAAVLATITGLLVANGGSATSTALIWAGAVYAAAVLGVAAITERPGATMLARSVMLLAGALIALPGALLLQRAGIRVRIVV
ncbi:hypothetical protein [Kitasatospora sp. MBT66]|uniref:hypothetical protein n=1 Tax=Kitasatospora sp. MBT66 TaxID=1444769 RepID=UPI0005B92836|nr:hypothetical protein [Kitasatospora sp. MBT66]